MNENQSSTQNPRTAEVILIALAAPAFLMIFSFVAKFFLLAIVAVYLPIASGIVCGVALFASDSRKRREEGKVPPGALSVLRATGFAILCGVISFGLMYGGCLLLIVGHAHFFN